MKEYDIAIKYSVISDFSSGIGIMELSRKYEIPKSTLQGWIKKAIHNHHWRVESPNGPQSKGRCMVCNEERYFKNSIEQSVWPKSRPEGPNNKHKTEWEKYRLPQPTAAKVPPTESES